MSRKEGNVNAAKEDKDRNLKIDKEEIGKQYSK